MIWPTVKKFPVLFFLVVFSTAPISAQSVTNAWFGNSETAGGFVTSGLPRLYHPWMVSYLREEGIENYAVGGSHATHQSVAIFGNTPAANRRYFYSVGTNDNIGKGYASAQIETFKSIVSAQVYWMAGNKVIGQNAAWSYTGNWSNNNLLGIGKYTGTPGDTATITFTGDLFLFGYIIGDSPYGGTFNIAIDSVDKGTFPITAGTIIQSGGAGPNWGPAVLRVAGLGSGSHTAVITAVEANTTTPRLVFVEWLGVGSNNLPVYLLANPNLNQSIWPANVYDGVSVYNTALSGIASQAASDGYNVTYLDTSLTGTDMGPDGAHPTNQGEAKKTNILLNAIQ